MWQAEFWRYAQGITGAQKRGFWRCEPKRNLKE